MLQIHSLTITHKKDLRVIIRDFDLVISPGDKAVLIGEEGNGKSTILKWICDPHLIEEYADAEGTRTTQGEAVGYLPQELPDEDRKKTVFQYLSGLQAFQNAVPADLYRIASEPGFDGGRPRAAV
jgi:ATPase subunit of ABC transporter with duplicated ATPase domains